MLGHDMVDIDETGRGLAPIVQKPRVVGSSNPCALVRVVRRKNPDQNVTAVEGPMAAVVVKVFNTHSLAGLDVDAVFRKIPGVVGDKLQYLPFVARGQKPLVGSDSGIVGQTEGQMAREFHSQMAQIRLSSPIVVESSGDIVDQGVTAMVVVMITNIP